MTGKLNHNVKMCFQINNYIDTLMCGTEEQEMNKSSCAKMVFMDNIKQEPKVNGCSGM